MANRKPPPQPQPPVVIYVRGGGARVTSKDPKVKIIKQ